jgi:hypothetical protein
MRKGTIIKSVRDTLSSNDLLSDTSNHLRDVNLRTYKQSVNRSLLETDCITHL